MIHTVAPHFFQDNYPEKFLSALRKLPDRFTSLYLTGGAIRDILQGTVPSDLDLTLPDQSVRAAQFFASLCGGTFVLLDEEGQVARVVWQTLSVDFTNFREQSKTIEDDLRLRDFTVNALGVRFVGGEDLVDWFSLLDPCGGLSDLEAGCVRLTHKQAFKKDPLRILRAYRLLACWGKKFDNETSQALFSCSSLLERVSPERISAELDKIMASSDAHGIFLHMDGAGILDSLFPELSVGKKVDQPGSHHLDVFRHNLATLKAMESLAQTRESYGFDEEMANYLANQKRFKLLKWAAFFHDIGKPVAQGNNKGRITFYGHDLAGAKIFSKIACRLRWKNRDRESVSRLIKQHMWPFHLVNARRKTGIKPRACLKIHKALGQDLPGLFLLALSDSLAAQGEDKPADMEKSIISLFHHVNEVITQKVAPVLAEPVLNGRDLIENFQLTPGPIFQEIFRALEVAQVAQKRMMKQDAIKWVGRFLEGK